MKWLVRTFANAIVRRLAFVLVAATLAWCGIGKSHAATVQCDQDGTGCNKQEAYQDAVQYVNAEALAFCQAVQASDSVVAQKPVIDMPKSSPPGSGNWQSKVQCQSAIYGTSTLHNFHAHGYGPCPVDAPWDEATHSCKGPDPECAAKPDLTNQYVTGTGGGIACYQGCAYSVDIATLKTLGEGENKRTWGGIWAPTGMTCSTGATPKPFDPTQQTCRQVSTLTECVKPNGDHCWTSSAGKSLCWKPNETGPKATTDGSFAGDRQPAPNTPTPPVVIENPTAGPTSQTTVNNTTYNSGTFSGTVTNGTPGQPNTGVDGDKDGDGKADGDGGDGEGPGAPGGTPGSLYTPNGKTVATVFANFKSQVMQSPVINAANGFLSGCSGGGSCPNETWDGGEWAGVHTLQNLCNGALGTILGWAGYAALAGMCWVAFRFAFFQG